MRKEKLRLKVFVENKSLKWIHTGKRDCRYSHHFLHAVNHFTYYHGCLITFTEDYIMQDPEDNKFAIHILVDFFFI